MSAVPVPEFFEFEDWPNYHAEKAAAALIEHPAVYVNQLVLAKHLEGWAKKMHQPAEANPQMFGFADALMEVASHLRQGDYLPGSPEFG